MRRARAFERPPEARAGAGRDRARARGLGAACGAALALAALLALGALARPATAGPGDGGPLAAHRIVAEVNGSAITYKDLLDHLALDPQWRQAVEARGAAAASERALHEKNVLDRLIDELLLAQEAEARGLGLTPNEERDVERDYEAYVKARWQSKDQLQAYLEERGIRPEVPFSRFRRSVLGQKLLQMEIQRLDSFVRPTEIRGYYDRNRDRYQTPRRIVYRHIWVDRAPDRDDEARARIDQALAELAAGAAWNEVCARFHDGANKADGGRQEQRDPNAIVLPLREAIQALRPGETSGVIDVPMRQARGRVIPGAFVVVRLEERTEEGTKPIDEVEDDIRKHLRGARHDEVLKTLLEELRRRATVRVRLGD